MAATPFCPTTAARPSISSLCGTANSGKQKSLATAPIPDQEAIVRHVDALRTLQAEVHQARRLITDWYLHSLGIATVPTVLREPFRLDANQFVAAVSKARGRQKPSLSAAAIARIREEYGNTVEPTARRLGEALQHERAISDLVNAAYGLTSDEIALMWRTAPPRMPLGPKEELRRLGFDT